MFANKNKRSGILIVNGELKDTALILPLELLNGELNDGVHLIPLTDIEAS